MSSIKVMRKFYYKKDIARNDLTGAFQHRNLDSTLKHSPDLTRGVVMQKHVQLVDFTSLLYFCVL